MAIISKGRLQALEEKDNLIGMFSRTEYEFKVEGDVTHLLWQMTITSVVWLAARLAAYATADRRARLGGRFGQYEGRVLRWLRLNRPIR